MSEYPKYLRLVMEIEVEVVDPVAAKTYTFDIAHEPDGASSFAPSEPEEHVAQVVSQVFAENHAEFADRAGVKMISGRTFPRGVGEDGAYAETVIPAMPRRLSDGSLVFPDGMEPPA